MVGMSVPVHPCECDRARVGGTWVVVTNETLSSAMYGPGDRYTDCRLILNFLFCFVLV